MLTCIILCKFLIPMRGEGGKCKNVTTSGEDGALTI